MAAPNTEKKTPKSPHLREEEHETLVRIAGRDLPGSKKVWVGLTRIKGVSWAIANAACLKLKIGKDKKIADMSKEDIATVETFLSNPDVPDYMKNRQKDVESGESRHDISNDLDMTKDFDIRRLKKIRNYRGIRHSAGLPVRGQRTRSNFRKNKGKAASKKAKK